MNPIQTSIFDLLKIGPGPSSSHTIAPMKAGFYFISAIMDLPLDVKQNAHTVEVILLGSLAATGEGHGTPNAVIAGLMGNAPETCSSETLINVANATHYSLNLGDGIQIPFLAEYIKLGDIVHSYPHSNTLIFRLKGQNSILFEKIYFSMGGGFLKCDGDEESICGTITYPYCTMTTLKKQLIDNKISLPELMIENECSLTGMPKEVILEHLYQIIDAMEQSVVSGLKGTGNLPGPIGLPRKAAVMFAHARQENFQGAGFFKALNAYAFAGAEENASGHRIVTAPTCGSAGVLPSIAYALKYHLGANREAIQAGLLAAVAIGFLCKHNASISGAEVGCQGEVGVASAMGAAMLTYIHNQDMQQTENAAEIALEHHLGLTCDPVLGYVQIPCIERNAMGVVKAYNAYLIASTLESSYQKVNFDKAVAAMAQTGYDMSQKYKETSLGGLAQSMTEC